MPDLPGTINGNRYPDQNVLTNSGLLPREGQQSVSVIAGSQKPMPEPSPEPRLISEDYDCGGNTVEKKLALQMRGITKRFGSVLANDHVDLEVYQGEILGNSQVNVILLTVIMSQAETSLTVFHSQIRHISQCLTISIL